MNSKLHQYRKRSLIISVQFFNNYKFTKISLFLDSACLLLGFDWKGNSKFSSKKVQKDQFIQNNPGMANKNYQSLSYNLLNKSKDMPDPKCINCYD